MGLFYIKKCEISHLGNSLRMPNDDNDVPLDGTSFVCKVLGKDDSIRPISTPNKGIKQA